MGRCQLLLHGSTAEGAVTEEGIAKYTGVRGEPGERWSQPNTERNTRVSGALALLTAGPNSFILTPNKDRWQISQENLLALPHQSRVPRFGAAVDNPV